MLLNFPVWERTYHEFMVREGKVSGKRWKESEAETRELKWRGGVAEIHQFINSSILQTRQISSVAFFRTFQKENPPGISKKTLTFPPRELMPVRCHSGCNSGMAYFWATWFYGRHLPNVTLPIGKHILSRNSLSSSCLRWQRRQAINFQFNPDCFKTLSTFTHSDKSSDCRSNGNHRWEPYIFILSSLWLRTCWICLYFTLCNSFIRVQFSTIILATTDIVFVLYLSATVTCNEAKHSGNKSMA